MGLTIHYQLSAPAELSSKDARAFVVNLGRYACHLGFPQVSEVYRANSEEDLATNPLLGAPSHKTINAGTERSPRYVHVPALRGWLFTANPGDGCQHATFGLCQYPRRVRSELDGGRRQMATGLPQGWHFSWFCKTQFAGKCGAAHFVRCHKSVVSLLDFCRKAGLGVTVRDEAGYWENRDEVELAKTVRRNEALLAAFGSLLKDMTDRHRDRKIKSPIFDYANFEHLEHEGWQHYGKLFAPLLRN